MFIGLGTLVNVATITVGALLGTLLGERLPARHRSMVTAILGLISLVIGGFSVVAAGSPALTKAVGSGVLVVLVALLVGGLAGTSLRLEERMDDWAERVRVRLHAGGEGGRFADGLVTSSLVFCVGPLAILGSLSDGLGHGAEQLLVKSVLDGFAALIFASSFGISVALSALVAGIYQGFWTLVGLGMGDVLPLSAVDALTATGGVILIALGFRLAEIKHFPVGDMLPALIVAPLVAVGVGAVLGG